MLVTTLSKAGIKRLIDDGGMWKTGVGKESTNQHLEVFATEDRLIYSVSMAPAQHSLTSFTCLLWSIALAFRSICRKNKSQLTE